MNFRNIIIVFQLLSALTYAEAKIKFAPVKEDGTPTTYENAYQICANRFNKETTNFHKLVGQYNELYNEYSNLYNQCSGTEHSDAYYRDQEDLRRFMIRNSIN